MNNAFATRNYSLIATATGWRLTGVTIASRGQIQADEAQVRRDRAEIKRLRADIKRDRRLRQRYRGRY